MEVNSGPQRGWAARTEQTGILNGRNSPNLELFQDPPQSPFLCLFPVGCALVGRQEAGQSIDGSLLPPSELGS